ncbi:TIGR00730 family Rossman fold protein [Asticcacaulis tiandongensis]|uniref:LOG family protein n=1 Tax=Asticcacaulis tiandongensis TaxID=2565365 RepID=UPI00112863A4|nr:TIGR00730 family Rossman fold protein [Asticcacaulis tiandongensis]
MADTGSKPVQIPPGILPSPCSAQRPIRSICVYCGSSDNVEPRFKIEAYTLGKTFAENGLRLVYGGGGVGLMGECARGAHENGGRVIGIMPEFLRSRERLYDDVETVVVQTMHERKMRLFDEADAFVVLPGGVGTLEEVIELLSWRRLDLHKKPIIFLNSNGFWEDFFALVNHTIEKGFTPEAFRHTYMSVETVEQILDAVSEMSCHDESIDTRKML